MLPKRRVLRRLAPVILFFVLLKIYSITEVGDDLLGKDNEMLGYAPSWDVLDKDARHLSFEDLLRNPAIVLDKDVGTGVLKEDTKMRASNLDSMKQEGRQLSRVPAGSKSSVDDSIIPMRKDVSGRALWMRVSDDVYTYSAFWDSRSGLPDGPVVRVLGIMRYWKELVKEEPGYKWSGVVKEDKLNISCFLWYKHQQKPKQGSLKAFIFEEGLKEFVGTFFLCYPRQIKDDLPLNGNIANPIPYAISFSNNSTVDTTHKLVYIKDTDNTTTGSSEGTISAVCVRPLHGPYTDLVTITQFISYYKTVLRVTYFYFYDLAVSAEVRELLGRLSEAVNIEILAWNVPSSDWRQLWDLGSLTALNDCVYRSSSHHSYIAIVDLDEFIVPRVPATSLDGIYSSVLKHKRGQMGDAALIPNAFFCHEFSENLNVTRENFPIFGLTRREARLWPPKSRSKMILTPWSIVSVGHHMVHSFLATTSKNRPSPKQVSVLHHYRECVGLRLGIHATGRLVLNQETQKDATIVKYKKDVLTSKIVSIYEDFVNKDSP
ncbi:uncharacterized protein [Cherax quadricarinatus]|uniref:uncharacterized protein n=1 Tax=Cherax quadricarinatus TaxID=27406 RepID=UPI00387E98B4